MNPVIIKPIITEQTMTEAEKGKYTFAVATQAEKPAIKIAIEKMFPGVHVTDVATRIIKGRSIRVGKKRTEMKLPHVKKATVTLAKGQTIGLFTPGGTKEEK
jgi:large subunit ribosomal protein L23